MRVILISHYSGLVLGISARGYQKVVRDVANVYQLNAVADHSRLTIEQGAKVVLLCRNKECYCYPEKILGCFNAN
jgi:hypothetical protein